MLHRSTQLLMILVCLAALAGCGDQGPRAMGVGAGPTEVPAATVAAQPTSMPDSNAPPTATAEANVAATQPTLPAVVPEEPGATSAATPSAATGARPVLIFFSAPG